jgi:hypothetical protein
VRELVGEFGDDLDEVVELLRIALAQIVVRQQIQRHDADAEIIAPAQELVHLRGPGAVTVRDRREPACRAQRRLPSIIMAT